MVLRAGKPCRYAWLVLATPSFVLACNTPDASLGPSAAGGEGGAAVGGGGGVTNSGGPA